MDVSLIGPETVELLSRIAGSKLSKKEITPPVLFLVNLVIILVGAIYIDCAVTEQEKQRLRVTFNQFVLPEGSVPNLTELIIRGVAQNQIYKKLNYIEMLAAPLSKPERLLLISFGYKMLAVDGELDARDKKYLTLIANKLEIKSQHIEMLELTRGAVEPEALEEVKNLLNPSNFKQLNNFLVKAQDDLATSYPQLKRFQKHQQDLANICDYLQSTISNANNRRILSDTFKNRMFQSFQKLKLESFRVAIVGEFSQGKSTLLNALLGEEIQPVRATPCSGTITVLKYGKQKRVVCRYKDGREEEIPFEQYQEKAAISEDAALGDLSDELAETEIEEIICYHPGLDLCRSGVEILDSPGLNEHPERTAIVNKLLEEIDAVIFLTNATSSLTQGEIYLLQDLRNRLNFGKGDEPANNLFVVVNFWDSLDTEKDRQQVQKRCENLVMGESPIIAGENRLHFISAKSALGAKKAGKDDDYLINFKKFVAALENFMTLERGALKVQHSVTKIKGLIQESLGELKQAENLLEGKVKLSEEAKQKIFEQIGEASGGLGKIVDAAGQLIENNEDKVIESWNSWVEGLASRIAEKAEKWHSKHSPLSDRKKVEEDYTQQFQDSLSNELQMLLNTKVKDIVLKDINELNLKIYDRLQAIRANLQELDLEVNVNLNEQFDLAIENLKGGGFDDANPEEANTRISQWSWWTVGAIFAVAAGIATGAVIPSLILAIPAGETARLKPWLNKRSEEQAGAEVKQQVFESGFEKFDESSGEIFNQIYENILTVFSNKIESAGAVIDRAIHLYEDLLEQQEIINNKTAEECNKEKASINADFQRLEKIQNQLEAILNEATSS
jgi:uncharacterized tellurite resistance protein B-like protein/GTPase SAR1 family protein